MDLPLNSFHLFSTPCIKKFAFVTEN